MGTLYDTFRHSLWYPKDFKIWPFNKHHLISDMSCNQIPKTHSILFLKHHLFVHHFLIFYPFLTLLTLMMLVHLKIRTLGWAFVLYEFQSHQ